MCNMQTGSIAANWMSVMRGSRSRRSSNRCSKNTVGMITSLQHKLDVQQDQVEVKLESQPLSQSYPNADRLRQAVPEGHVAGALSLPPPFLWEKKERGGSNSGCVGLDGSLRDSCRLSSYTKSRLTPEAGFFGVCSCEREKKKG